MSERSVELAKQSITETIKYDYFVVGISSATFVYFAKDFTPATELILDSKTLIAASLLLLAVSVISGLKKIKTHIFHLQVNSKYLDASSHFAAYQRNAIEGGTAINSNTGEILQPFDSSIKASALNEIIPKYKNELDKLGNRVYLSSKVRDYSLFLAYLVIATSKLLPLFGHVI